MTSVDIAKLALEFARELGTAIGGTAMLIYVQSRAGKKAEQRIAERSCPHVCEKCTVEKALPPAT